jgi:hypothetical protein
MKFEQSWRAAGTKIEMAVPVGEKVRTDGGRRLLGRLVAIGVLALACSSQEVSGSPGGGGPGGNSAGGVGGNVGPGGSSAGSDIGEPPDGAPGTGGTLGCLATPDSCVSTCMVSGPIRDRGYCDSTGVFACPAGYTRFTSCPPGACAWGGTCCDGTTGMITHPSCGPDGFLAECPAGSDVSSTGICIPASLGVSDCSDLVTHACDLLDQRCHDAFGNNCFCGPGGDGGLSWSCPFGPP